MQEMFSALVRLASAYICVVLLLIQFSCFGVSTREDTVSLLLQEPVQVHRTVKHKKKNA